MPTLLIIDDNESVRTTLGHVFARLGYTVHVAHNGEAGLALFAEKNIDVALVDINMPGLNGVQVCRAICMQAKAAGKEFPVWLMTGAIGGYVEDLGIDAGAIAVLHKPFDIQQFNRDVERRLRGETKTSPAPESSTTPPSPHSASPIPPRR
jgi:DNA-binding response OmpR family regulator